MLLHCDLGHFWIFLAPGACYTLLKVLEGTVGSRNQRKGEICWAKNRFLRPLQLVFTNFKLFSWTFSTYANVKPFPIQSFRTRQVVDYWESHSGSSLCWMIAIRVEKWAGTHSDSDVFASFFQDNFSNISSRWVPKKENLLLQRDFDSLLAYRFSRCICLWAWGSHSSEALFSFVSGTLEFNHMKYGFMIQSVVNFICFKCSSQKFVVIPSLGDQVSGMIMDSGSFC